VHVAVKYSTDWAEQDAGVSHNAQLPDKDCGRDKSCADMYAAENAVGTNHRCYYDPEDLSKVLCDISYTAWKWVLTAFPMASILGLLCCCSYALLSEQGYTHNPQAARGKQVMLWFGLLLPLGFFVPLAATPQIEDGGRVACMSIGAVMAATGGVAGVWTWLTSELSESEIWRIQPMLHALAALLGCVSLPIGVLVPLVFSSNFDGYAGASLPSSCIISLAVLAGVGPLVGAAVVVYTVQHLAKHGEHHGPVVRVESNPNPLLNPEYSSPDSSTNYQDLAAPVHRRLTAQEEQVHTAIHASYGERHYQPLTTGYESLPSGVWRGWYWQYGSQHNLCEFSLSFKVPRNNQARQQRFKIKGEGHDDVGQYTIKGTVNTSDGNMSFDKNYIRGTGNPQENYGHCVVYSGRLISLGQGFKGCWSINHWHYRGSGDFHLWPIEPAWNPAPPPYLQLYPPSQPPPPPPPPPSYSDHTGAWPPPPPPMPPPSAPRPEWERFVEVDQNAYDVTADGQCVVCMNSQVDTVLVPCGHIACCAKCAKRLIKRDMACPVCRQAIKQVHVLVKSGGIPLREGATSSDGYCVGFYGAPPSAPPMDGGVGNEWSPVGVKGGCRRI